MRISFSNFKVPISCLRILHICNLWILLRKIVIYLVGRKCHLRGLFLLTESDVKAGKLTEVTSKREN